MPARLPTVCAILCVLLLPGCTPSHYRLEADEVTSRIIEEKQEGVLGHVEPFTIERPSDALRRRLLLGQELPTSHPLSLGVPFAEPVEHFPELERLARLAEEAAPPWNEPGPLRLGLTEALEVAARNSREYQNAKETVFQTALRLDLERDLYRPTLEAFLSSEYTLEPRGNEPNRQGLTHSGTASASQLLRSGIQLTTRLTLDLVKLLTLDRTSSLGQLGDASIAIPLWRGSGEEIQAEPLTQAERDVVYAIWEFERFKRVFAVRVASDYLGVLQQLDQVHNARQNYEGLVASTRRARRLAQAGRLPGIEVGEALQDELRARNRWISAQEAYQRRLDSFALVLGLPPDARLELDPGALQRLGYISTALAGASQAASVTTEDLEEIPPADAPIQLVPAVRTEGGPLEMDPGRAIRLALERRLDLKVAIEEVYDSERRVVVAADSLRGELTLLGSATVGERRSLGSAGLDDARLDFGQGFYSGLLAVDLPLERTAERNLYRTSLIELERQSRELEGLEDTVKLDVRNDLRNLLEARETVSIQAQALALAQRRVEATQIFLEAGRAQIRDLLFAQESLVSAQNALTAAQVGYRVAELELQRDMGVLEVNEEGLWTEFSLEDLDHGDE